MNEIGKYQILKKIGTGGMATVYLVRDKLMDKHFAMKILHNQYLENKKIRDRFIQEAKVQINLTHPNIIRCYDVDFQSGYYYILLEYIKGKSLAEVLNSQPGNISLESNLAIFIQLLAAIGYAHRQGVVHRDIKPHNVLVQNYKGRLSERDIFKVGDFGIAKALALGADSHTRAGARLGTLQYMSPEQIQDSAAVDVRSDIYSMGVTFFQLITGSLPYHDTSNEFSIMEAIVKQPITLPDKYRRLYPAWVENLIRKATEKEARNRFRNCDEFMAAIQEGLNGPAKPAIQQPTEYVATQFTDATPPYARPELNATTPAIQKKSSGASPSIPSEKRKSSGPVLAIIFGVILLLTVTVFAVRYFYQAQPMPDLVGLQVGQARQVLSKYNVPVIHYIRQNTGAVSAGIVLETKPGSGSRAFTRGDVEITYAYKAGQSNKFKQHSSSSAQEGFDAIGAFPYDLLFVDVFEKTQMDWINLGGIASEDRTECLDGEIILEKKSKDGAAMLLGYPGPKLINFALRVDFVNSVRSANQSAGIGLKTGKDLVTFLINPLVRKVFCGTHRFNTWDGKWILTEAINPNTRNSLELVGYHGQISMFMNGKLLRKLIWDSETSFRPLLMNNMPGKPAKFDNVVIVGLL